MIRQAADEQKEAEEAGKYKNDRDREISELPALKNQAERLALKMGIDKKAYLEELNKIRGTGARITQPSEGFKSRHAALNLYGIDIKGKIRQRCRFSSMDYQASGRPGNMQPAMHATLGRNLP
jgi:hypothetical protein